jgi:hypothetical protein
MTIPGFTAFSILHRSVRFTDATSNFGWSAAASEAIAQIADRPMVDRKEIFVT